MAAPSPSFEAAVRLAGSENYLGSSQVVDDYLRNFATDALERNGAEGKDDHQKLDADLQACYKASRVFLGEDSAFSSVPVWNSPGHIDKFLAKELNTPETDPSKIIQVLFVRFLTEIYKIAKYSDLALPEQWEWQVEAAIENYRNMLIGVQTVNN